MFPTRPFARRLVQSAPRLSDFEAYQKQEIDWLISRGYLEVNLESVVQMKNVFGIVFLGEIHRHGCLNYNYYSGEAKDTLDSMIGDGILKSESTLFSRPEMDYIDFHLNRHRFTNSLDLRNKYAHGSHSGSQGGEDDSKHDYLQLLKILVCVVLKINDDLCANSKVIQK